MRIVSSFFAAFAFPSCMDLNRTGKIWGCSLCLIHTYDRFVHLEFDNHWNDHSKTTLGSF